MIEGGVSVAARQRMIRALLSGDWYLALYTAAANLSPRVTHYTPEGEAAGPGYKPGGRALENARVVVDGDAACFTFDDCRWPNATVKARGGMIYDKRSGEVLVLLDFGEDKISSNGPFTVFMPLAAAGTALVEL